MPLIRIVSTLTLSLLSLTSPAAVSSMTDDADVNRLILQLAEPDSVKTAENAPDGLNKRAGLNSKPMPRRANDTDISDDPVPEIEFHEEPQTEDVSPVAEE